MPLVFAESQVTAAGIQYDDRTGVSYQYPNTYRRLILPGERFVYYRGRRTHGGGRAPQVYFGTGIVGQVSPDPREAGRFACEVLDYHAFPVPVSFKDERGLYFESRGDRRGYFQPGVRVIPDAEFERILQAAQMTAKGDSLPSAPVYLPDAGYASPATLRAVEEFAVRIAIDEVRRRHPTAVVEPQPRNNPGFDLLVREGDASRLFYVEVKGTTRHLPHFFMTEGEMQFARRHSEEFRLIIIYGIQLASGAYEVVWHEGLVSRDVGFTVKPVQWACLLESSGTPQIRT